MYDASETSDRIEKLIRQKCGRMGVLPNGWHLFSFRGRHFIYSSDGKGLLQFSIPFLLDSGEYKMDLVVKAVNDANRKLRFIKVLLLDNGAVSLAYDYLFTDAGQAGRIADHIIDTLDNAADYFVRQLDSQNLKQELC